MSKRDQLVAAAELLFVAKTCLVRIVNTAWGALDTQTKSELEKADHSLAEVMRLVDNAKDRICEKGTEK